MRQKRRQPHEYYKDGKLKCADCSRWRLEKHFSKSKKNTHGRHTTCHFCTKIQRYGLKYKDYTKMVVVQANRCAICKEKEIAKQRLSIDHRHSDGKVRGLLCKRCNFAIGYVRENITILNNAITYLEKEW